MARAASNMSPEISERFSRADFDHSPMVVFYEVTQACDLVCRHCRACAQPRRHPDELDGELSKQLISQLAGFPKRPMLVITGGDPMKRDDLVDLVEHGVAAGLHVALTPSATPLVTRDAIRRLAAAGLSRLALSLDGADAAMHDRFRGVEGSFERTLEIMDYAREAGLPLQVNTTVTRWNVSQIDAVAALMADLGIVLWSVFFVVPVGRATLDDRIAPEEYEVVFERLLNHSKRQSYQIKTTEAPHYRHLLLEHNKNQSADQRGQRGADRSRFLLGTNDGKGVLFVSHAGLIHPSGFLPIVCGIYPWNSVVDVYQRSPIFRALRDADRLRDKCGVCEYRNICGGSRSRSYACTGDPLAAEPDCVYEPAAWQSGASSSRHADLEAFA
jgi:radical SAM protein